MMSPLERPLLIDRPQDLASVVERAARASVVALDVEGNGLFAYRARLCTVQLAWREREHVQVAVVDTLSVSPTPLAHLLGEDGPPKLLHDLTFDARMLLEAGIRLGKVRDTSVAAKMLGRKATGLASLLASELGITVEKELQQHDWSRRPLGERELGYLAADVYWLEALEERLARQVEALGIRDEVETECAYKLETSLAPSLDKRPAYLRIRGADTLSPLELAVLRRVVEAREEIASKWDVPPFKIASNDFLLELARRRPASRRDLRSLRGMNGRVMSVADTLLSAVKQGIDDGEVPENERFVRPRLDRAAIAERRERESRLLSWRRAEAARRGVDEQVVLPGHCLQAIAAGGAFDEASIAQIPGLGKVRADRYAKTLAALARGDALPVNAGATLS